MRSGLSVLMLVSCVQMIRTGESNTQPVLITDSKFLKKAVNIKQCRPNDNNGFDILTEKSGLFLFTDSEIIGDSRVFSKAQKPEFAIKHRPILFVKNLDRTLVTVNSDNQLIMGNEITASICNSKPYRLELLHSRDKQTVFVVASSWPTIHFVFQKAFCDHELFIEEMSLGNRLRNALSDSKTRQCEKLSDSRSKIEDAYLLSVGQEEGDSYIIYAQVNKGNTDAKNESSIVPYRKFKTDYCTFTVKKMIVNDIFNLLSSELLKQTATEELCTIEDVPVDGTDVPFIIDYRNKAEWAVVCKKKDGYHVKAKACSERKIRFIDSERQHVKDALIAIQVQQQQVKFYCKNMESEAYVDFSDHLQDVLGKQIVLQKYADNNLLIGSWGDQERLHLLFKPDSGFFYEFFRGVKQISITSISRAQDQADLTQKIKSEAEVQNNENIQWKMKLAEENRKEQEGRALIELQRQQKEALAQKNRKAKEERITIGVGFGEQVVENDDHFFDHAAVKELEEFKTRNNLTEEAYLLLKKMLKEQKVASGSGFYAMSPEDQLEWFNEQKKQAQKNR